MDLSVLRNRAFRIFHGVWALIWIGLTVYLLSIPKSGDMPASLLVVFSIPAGVLGHVLIQLIAFVKQRGDKLVARRTGQLAPDWPWLMLLVAVIVLITTFKMGYRFYWVDLSFYLATPERMLFFAKLMLLMLFKLACLLGLLLRQPWSKWLVIGLFSYWFVEALYVAYLYWKNYPDFLLVRFARPAGYAVLSLFLVSALLRSRAVQTFYGKQDSGLKAQGSA